MTSLATKIKNLRDVKELGQAQLAARVPMEKSYLSRIERGEDPNLGRKILRGLAKGLDVRIDYLDDDSIDETRSWEKVAADESLALFCKESDLSEDEMVNLRRVSFTQSAPYTLVEWRRLWNNLNTYLQSKHHRRLKSRLKTRKNVNLGDI